MRRRFGRNSGSADTSATWMTSCCLPARAGRFCERLRRCTKRSRRSAYTSTALLLSLGLVGLSARRRALRWGCSSGGASFRVPSRQDTVAVRVSLNLCPTGSDFECQLAVGGFVKSKAQWGLDATDLHAYPSFGGRPTGVGGRSSADRGQTIGETSPQIFASTSTCWRSTVG